MMLCLLAHYFVCMRWLHVTLQPMSVYQDQAHAACKSCQAINLSLLLNFLQNDSVHGAGKPEPEAAVHSALAKAVKDLTQTSVSQGSQVRYAVILAMSCVFLTHANVFCEFLLLHPLHYYVSPLTCQAKAQYVCSQCRHGVATLSCGCFARAAML